ncbi:MAG TPA: formimidoylglutamate deiminase [Pyrinomonadaceae bacterium]
MSNQLRTQTWIPELIYVNGRFVSDTALVTDNKGRILELGPAASYATGTRLQNRAILSGLVNAHSHAFQRVIRGRTEYRSSDTTDSFWTWRELMYRAANTLDVDDIYVASRMAFLEMALSGITAVGEFHYLHHAPNGEPYDDPNLIAKEVIRAAHDAGLRIALLRVAYERSGFNQGPNPLQKRFIESAETYCHNLDRLRSDLGDNASAWAGSAPHSIRAVSLNYLKTVNDYASQNNLAMHMHVAEQPAEVAACIEEHGRSPVALLDTEGLLSDKFTAVHAIHVTSKAIPALAKNGAFVCACPTTERNLGDGVVPADEYLENGVPMCFGTDSHAQIDLLEDARELEYHLRLQRKERNVLAPSNEHGRAALATRLFDCVTINGAKSIHFDGGLMKSGAPADFFTVDLNDPSIAGASEENLLSNIVFALSRTAIKDVVVQGKRIVEDGHHQDEGEIIEQFSSLQSRLWGKG